MKLCTICDKKMQGTWCKNCHRFVKTYELPGRIYLNERHDPVNDRNCTYHTDPVRNVSENRTSTGSGTQHTYSAGTSGSASGTNPTEMKKKGKKAALLVIIGYILVNSLGIVGPAVVKSLREGFQLETNEKDNRKDNLQLSDKELKELFERENLDETWLALTPECYMEGDESSFLYYDPEKVKEFGYSCDGCHFDYNLQQFDMWLAMNWTDGFVYEDDESMYSNYYYIKDGESRVWFASFREYCLSDDFEISVDYDTGTDQVHVIRVYAKNGTEDIALYYSLLDELNPGLPLTKRQFEADLEEAKEVGDYATLYYLDQVYLAFVMDEEGYCLKYYPVEVIRG